MRVRRTLAIAWETAAVGFSILYLLGRRWGATRGEVRRDLPGDDIIVKPTGGTMHAISIAAPPSAVWPWIVQMGYHRAGWYTYPWVDRFVWHIDNPSADRIIERFQDVAVDDVIPDGEPGTAWYVVDRLEPERLLVLHSTTHVPVALRRRHPEAAVDWTWTFFLEPQPDGGTRLLLRVRPWCSPWWMRVLYHLVIVPSDFIMARSMLGGIRARAEASWAASATSHHALCDTALVGVSEG